MDNQNSKYSEKHQLLKIISLRFPHPFKKVGIIGAVLLSVFLFGYIHYGGSNKTIKDLYYYGILALLVLASYSKEAVEDEYIQQIRLHSYFSAFSVILVCSVTNWLYPLVINTLSSDGIGNKEFSTIGTMLFMVVIQLLLFEAMKRYGLGHEQYTKKQN